MEHKRDSFIFHKDWYDAISSLDDKTRCEVYDAIMQKVWGDGNCNISPLAQMAMRFISPHIDRDTNKWLETKEKRQESGKMGGLAKQANATKCYQMLPNATNDKQTIANVINDKQKVANLPISVSVSVSDNDNVDNNNVILKEIEDKSSTKKKPRATFIPPTLDEVEAYIKEKGYHFSAKAFIDYYAADDWHLGRGTNRRKVSNWKQCCVTWENKRTSDNGLFAQDEPQQDHDEILLKRIYETMPESQQAKILQLDPYSYHMLPEKGKNIYREARKQLMLDWLKEHNE